MNKFFLFLGCLLVFCSTHCSTAHAEWNPDKDALLTAAGGQGFDLVTTGFDLGFLANAVEASPIGIVVVPLKLVATAGLLPMVPESEQVTVAKRMAAFGYGAGVSNVALWLTSSFAIPIGVAAGGYVLMCNSHMLPAGLCPFAETVAEELDRRVDKAHETGFDLKGFILTRNEATSLESELGFLPTEWRGYFLQVEAPVHFDEEVELSWG